MYIMMSVNSYSCFVKRFYYPTQLSKLQDYACRQTVCVGMCARGFVLVVPAHPSLSDLSP